MAAATAPTTLAAQVAALTDLVETLFAVPKEQQQDGGGGSHSSSSQTDKGSCTGSTASAVSPPPPPPPPPRQQPATTCAATTTITTNTDRRSKAKAAAADAIISKSSAHLHTLTDDLPAVMYEFRTTLAQAKTTLNAIVTLCTSQQTQQQQHAQHQQEAPAAAANAGAKAANIHPTFPFGTQIDAPESQHARLARKGAFLASWRLLHDHRTLHGDAKRLRRSVVDSLGSLGWVCVNDECRAVRCWAAAPKQTTHEPTITTTITRENRDAGGAETSMGTCLHRASYAFAEIGRRLGLDCISGAANAAAMSVTDGGTTGSLTEEDRGQGGTTAPVVMGNADVADTTAAHATQVKSVSLGSTGERACFLVDAVLSRGKPGVTAVKCTFLAGEHVDEVQDPHLLHLCQTGRFAEVERDMKRVLRFEHIIDRHPDLALEQYYLKWSNHFEASAWAPCERRLLGPTVAYAFRRRSDDDEAKRDSSVPHGSSGRQHGIRRTPAATTPATLTFVGCRIMPSWNGAAVKDEPHAAGAEAIQKTVLQHVFDLHPPVAVPLRVATRIGTILTAYNEHSAAQLPGDDSDLLRLAGSQYDGGAEQPRISVDSLADVLWRERSAEHDIHGIRFCIRGAHVRAAATTGAASAAQVDAMRRPPDGIDDEPAFVLSQLVLFAKGGEETGECRTIFLRLARCVELLIPCVRRNSLFSSCFSAVSLNSDGADHSGACVSMFSLPNGLIAKGVTSQLPWEIIVDTTGAANHNPFGVVSVNINGKKDGKIACGVRNALLARGSMPLACATVIYAMTRQHPSATAKGKRAVCSSGPEPLKKRQRVL